MKLFAALSALFFSSMTFAAGYPAFRVNCDLISGTTNVKRFSLQVYNDDASGALVLTDETRILSFPNLFNDVELTKPVSFDRDILKLEIHHIDHTQTYYSIVVDKALGTASLVDDQYYDIPTPTTFSGAYSCTFK